MSTEKRYLHKRICICRTCRGTGKLLTFDRCDWRRENPRQTVCTQCGGTGRVVVSGETSISVEPFKEEGDG